MKIWRTVVAVCCVGLLLWSCTATKPLPQPRRVADPADAQGAIINPRWDIAAVAYKHEGDGIDYADAGLAPVFLVFHNKFGEQPRVDPAETRGVSPKGEFLPYTLSEAERLVFASETFSVTASNAARTGALGAVVGAGLGFLVGAVGGGDNLWKGAAIGAGVGAVAGGAITLPEAEDKLQSIIREELSQYAWRDDPLPPQYTKVGYLYFPSDVDIERVKIVVRSGEDIRTYDIPLVQPPE